MVSWSTEIWPVSTQFEGRRKGGLFGSEQTCHGIALILLLCTAPKPGRVLSPLHIRLGRGV